jgi:hypothetical protein
VERCADYIKKFSGGMKRRLDRALFSIPRGFCSSMSRRWASIQSRNQL